MSTSAVETTTSAATTAARTPNATEIAFNYLMFGLSTIISLAFAYYLISNPTVLTDAWVWIRSLPLVIQLILWLLFLPWMIALWVWSMPWALALRLVLVVAIVAFAEYLLFPWKK